MAIREARRAAANAWSAGRRDFRGRASLGAARAPPERRGTRQRAHWRARPRRSRGTVKSRITRCAFPSGRDWAGVLAPAW